MSTPQDVADRLLDALRQATCVVPAKRGHAVWLIVEGTPAARLGAIRATEDRARFDGAELRVGLARAIYPFVEEILAEAGCGCTESDPIACVAAALARISISVPWDSVVPAGLACGCVCHQPTMGGAP